MTARLPEVIPLTVIDENSRELKTALNVVWMLCPHHSFVAAQAKRMPNRVGVDLPAVAFGPNEAFVQRGAKFNHATLFGLKLIDLEVEVVLLRVFIIRPARSAVIFDPNEGQLDLTKLYARPKVRALSEDFASRHFRVKIRQRHGIWGIDDEVSEFKHRAILSQVPSQGISIIDRLLPPRMLFSSVTEVLKSGVNFGTT